MEWLAGLRTNLYPETGLSLGLVMLGEAPLFQPATHRLDARDA